MDNSILRLKKTSQGSFCVPQWNCVKEQGLIFYKKPLLVREEDWVNFIKDKTSISSKVNKDGECLVFITSVLEKFNRTLEKEFLQKGWKSKGCIVLQGSKLSTVN